MPPTFSEHPILNSPYEYPGRHWELKNGLPTDQVINHRRVSEYLTAVPPALAEHGQVRILLGDTDLSTQQQEYDPTPIINEIRRRVDAWRNLPRSQWQVTPETARLLEHWRTYDFPNLRPFFCQVEAAETIIWLTEVAGVLPGERRIRGEYEGIRTHITKSNLSANPNLFRLALKLATGAGKTTVMAMLIAWQTVNAVRHPPATLFTKGFLVVTPGITIRDRLRCLLPNDPDNYYEHRDLVPKDLLSTVKQAQVVVTNFHAFRRRERDAMPASVKRLLQGRTGSAPSTQETEGQMLRRVMPELMRMKRIVVLNDEGHHCYRQRPDTESAERPLDADEVEEATENSEKARVWVSGIETISKLTDVIQVVDLSATPFFLRGSGYEEGTLFPWTVCDFSLMDAIEAGVVKIPRVPIDDNVPGGSGPVFRELWKHVRSEMPSPRRRQPRSVQDPRQMPTHLLAALETLYGNYETTFKDWEEAEIPAPLCSL